MFEILVITTTIIALLLTAVGMVDGRAIVLNVLFCLNKIVIKKSLVLDKTSH